MFLFTELNWYNFLDCLPIAICHLDFTQWTEFSQNYDYFEHLLRIKARKNRKIFFLFFLSKDFCENCNLMDRVVIRESPEIPTDYSKNLSWRRWPILLIFMVYGMTSTFQNSQSGMGTRLSGSTGKSGRFFRFNREFSGRFRLKSSSFFRFRVSPVQPRILRAVPVEALCFFPVPVFPG